MNGGNFGEPWTWDDDEGIELQVTFEGGRTIRDHLVAWRVPMPVSVYDVWEVVPAKRAVSCVNACAGIADPSVVPEAFDVLRTLVDCETVGRSCSYCGDFIHDDDSRCPVFRARALLARLYC